MPVVLDAVDLSQHENSLQMHREPLSQAKRAIQRNLKHGIDQRGLAGVSDKFNRRDDQKVFWTTVFVETGLEKLVEIRVLHGTASADFEPHVSRAMARFHVDFAVADRQFDLVKKIEISVFEPTAKGGQDRLVNFGFRRQGVFGVAHDVLSKVRGLSKPKKYKKSIPCHFGSILLIYGHSYEG